MNRIDTQLRPHAAPHPASRSLRRSATSLLLLLFSVLTMVWIGAAQQGASLWGEPRSFTLGLPYAAALLAIVAAHELGHTLTARRYGLRRAPPLMIPAPVWGTLGTVSRLDTPAPHRRAVFDVALAGPLAGLMVALPILFYGLSRSVVLVGASPLVNLLGHLDTGASFFVALVARPALGAAATEGHRLVLHSLAFAGWSGLLVTAVQLLPIGRLDGGYLARALFGSRAASMLDTATLFALVLLGLTVEGLLLIGALLVYLFAGKEAAEPLDDAGRIQGARLVLAAALLVLLLLMTIPVPQGLYDWFGLHRPFS